MLNRDALDYLTQWYNSSRRKPLLIRGARQVGKTTLVRMLADRLGVRLLEINLEKPWPFSDSFTELNPRHTIEAIEFAFNEDLDPARTIVFFDEAQACPSILPLLRYFQEEAPEYAVITTGSLLEFALAQPTFSMPVGRLELFHLGPLSFQEFLEGLAEAKALEFLRNFAWGDQIPQGVHSKLSTLVQTYCLAGGMPESVMVFAETGSLREAEKTRTQILETFRLDFNKYQGKSDPVLLNIVFDALPRLLGRKLVYARVSDEYRSRDVSAAVSQICLAGLATKVHHSDANGIPLAAEKRERFFKLVLLDVGLLLSLLKLVPSDFEPGADLNLINKGVVAEQFIGQQLRAVLPSDQTPDLFYWCREKPSSSAEIDYLWENKGKVVPVEVKAGKAGKLRSLQVMTKEKGLPRGVRFGGGLPTLKTENRETALGAVKYTLVSLPHYLVQQLPRLLTELPEGY